MTLIRIHQGNNSLSNLTFTTMKKRFLEEFEIIRMSRNSLIVRQRTTGEECFIHRNVFNLLQDAVDYRIKEVWFGEDRRSSNWIEVCCWRTC